MLREWYLVVCEELLAWESHAGTDGRGPGLLAAARDPPAGRRLPAHGHRDFGPKFSMPEVHNTNRETGNWQKSRKFGWNSCSSKCRGKVHGIALWSRSWTSANFVRVFSSRQPKFIHPQTHRKNPKLFCTRPRCPFQLMCMHKQLWSQHKSSVHFMLTWVKNCDLTKDLFCNDFSMTFTALWFKLCQHTWMSVVRMGLRRNSAGSKIPDSQGGCIFHWYSTGKGTMFDLLMQHFLFYFWGSGGFPWPSPEIRVFVLSLLFECLCWVIYENM